MGHAPRQILVILDKEQLYRRKQKNPAIGQLFHPRDPNERDEGYVGHTLKSGFARKKDWSVGCRDRLRLRLTKGPNDGYAALYFQDLGLTRELIQSINLTTTASKKHLV